MNFKTFFPIADIPNLRDLDLSHNPLQKIESGAFEMIPQLETLDVSHCDVQRIAAKAFEGLGALKKVRLDHNALRSLRPRTVASLTALHGVELAGNPWRCDCSLREVKRLLSSGRVPSSEEPHCAEPERLKGRLFADLEVSEFACPPEIATDDGPRYVQANAGKFVAESR